VKYLQRFTLLLAMVGILYSGVSSSKLVAEDLMHVVGRGETIWSISRFYSVSADELMRVNGIADPSTLQAGRRLVIPASNVSTLPASGPAISQALVDYRAVRGDTLFSIARTHGITLQRLLEINGFSANHALRAGDVIKVPGRNTVVSTATTAQNTAPVNNPPAGGLYSLRWPITPKEITYMTGQMGVVVEGEQFESVRSLTQGNVVSAGPWRKFGRVVIVETAGGYYYMYGGCETLSVSVGDRITPGMEVGRLGINSVSERPQLFFMVFRSDTPIDPALAPRAGSANSRDNS
jgi:murein DD-endopeptidase MepM/ murein hydrolase activator NlpD